MGHNRAIFALNLPHMQPWCQRVKGPFLHTKKKVLISLSAHSFIAPLSIHPFLLNWTTIPTGNFSLDTVTHLNVITVFSYMPLTVHARNAIKHVLLGPIIVNIFLTHDRSNDLVIALSEDKSTSIMLIMLSTFS